MKSLLLALAVFGVGCGAMTVADAGTNSADAGRDAGAVAEDAGGADAGALEVDAGAPDAGPAVDAGVPFGVCGLSSWQDICACAAGPSTQLQACFQGVLAQNPDCQTCVSDLQVATCPTQSATLDDCAFLALTDSDAGVACQDDACLQMRCAVEFANFNGCVRNHAMTPAYQAGFTACVGDLTRCQ